MCNKTFGLRNLRSVGSALFMMIESYCKSHSLAHATIPFAENASCDEHHYKHMFSTASRHIIQGTINADAQPSSPSQMQTLETIDEQAGNRSR